MKKPTNEEKFCCHNNKTKKGADQMSKVVDDVQVDIEKSIAKSLDEMDKIEAGILPTSSYKNMLKRVKQALDEEKK